MIVNWSQLITFLPPAVISILTALQIDRVGKDDNKTAKKTFFKILLILLAIALVITAFITGVITPNTDLNKWQHFIKSTQGKKIKTLITIAITGIAVISLVCYNLSKNYKNL